MRSNKFSIDWQICRASARSIKDVDSKLDYVVSFLKDNMSKENYDRVLNWLKMTRVAYRDEAVRKKFDTQIEYINSFDYVENDNDNDLSKISTENLELVYKDLIGRNYNFQFKTVPKDHTNFISALETELELR